MGNHGILRQHNVGFTDGHAAPVLYEVRTDYEYQATPLGGEIVHSGNYRVVGGGPEPVRVNGLDPATNAPWVLGDIDHLLFAGPGWTDYCFPAPSVLPGVVW